MKQQELIFPSLLLADINVDSIEMRTTESFLAYLLPDYMEDPLRSELVLSFRTSQPKALLLYAHDHLNNFIQLEVRSRDSLAVVYNSGADIKEAVVSLPGIGHLSNKMRKPLCMMAKKAL